MAKKKDTPKKVTTKKANGVHVVDLDALGAGTFSTVTCRATIVFDGPNGYICDAYTPAMGKLITITKKSGISRCRSEKTRKAALEAYLEKISMSLAEFRQLEADAKDSWDGHRVDKMLCITPERWLSHLSAVAYFQPRSQRFCDPDNVRTAVQCPKSLIFAPGKVKEDGVFERLVQPKDGTGKPLSNERILAKSGYVRDVSCDIEMAVDTDFVEPEAIAQAMIWGGQRVGVGAARKMGFGRYRVTKFEYQ